MTIMHLIANLSTHNRWPVQTEKKAWPDPCWTKQHITVSVPHPGCSAFFTSFSQATTPCFTRGVFGQKSLEHCRQNESLVSVHRLHSSLDPNTYIFVAVYSCTEGRCCKYTYSHQYGVRRISQRRIMTLPPEANHEWTELWLFAGFRELARLVMLAIAYQPFHEQLFARFFENESVWCLCVFDR